MDQSNTEALVTKYESYINDILKEDLRVLELRLKQVNGEIADLIQQKHTLKVLTNSQDRPHGFKSQVNLGCNFFMEAAVTDTSSMLLNIGLNHFVEFTVEETMKYLNARIEAYENKAKELINLSSDTKGHIKLLLLGIGELQKLN